MRRHLVIGASGHAQEVAWSLRESLRARGEDCELLFFDDGLPAGPVPGGLGDIVGGLEVVRDYARDASLVLGVGLPRVKRAVVERLAHLDLPWTVVVHPAAVVGPNVRLGEGSYLAAGGIVATVNGRIGRFVTVNFHCVVAHDDVVGDFATLHPDAHLSGTSRSARASRSGPGPLSCPTYRSAMTRCWAPGASPFARSAAAPRTSDCPRGPERRPRLSGPGATRPGSSTASVRKIRRCSAS